MMRLSLPGRRLLAYLAIRRQPRYAAWRRPSSGRTCQTRSDERTFAVRYGTCRAAGSSPSVTSSYSMRNLISRRRTASPQEHWRRAAVTGRDCAPVKRHSSRMARGMGADGAGCVPHAACSGTGSGLPDDGVDRSLRLGRTSRATAVAAEPLRESAAEALIDAHLAQRNRHQAVQCFRRLEQRLDEELGVEPDPALAARHRDQTRQAALALTIRLTLYASA